MNTVKTLLVMSVVFLLLHIGCKGKDDITTYNLTEMQKTFANFKEGSYWIMRDSITGNLDSLYIKKFVNRIFEPPLDNSIHIEERLFFIGQYDMSAGFDVDTFLIDLEVSGTGVQEFNFNRDYDTYINGFFFDLNFTTNNVLINGKTYSNVVYAAKSNVDGGLHYDMAAWIDQTNVLLKVRYTDNLHVRHVWELERANIIR